MLLITNRLDWTGPVPHPRITQRIATKKKSLVPLWRMLIKKQNISKDAEPLLTIVYTIIDHSIVEVQNEITINHEERKTI